MNLSTTRVLYYANNPDLVTSKDDITLTESTEGKQNCTVDFAKHGWHCLPNNTGLYATPCIIQKMFQNSRAWRPVQASWNICNPIPI